MIEYSTFFVGGPAWPSYFELQRRSGERHGEFVSRGCDGSAVGGSVGA